MTQKSRRRLLKGVAVTLPAAWSRPVIESVVLPAHAQTSEPDRTGDPGCSAPEGCYVIPGDFTLSFFWPGGAGPHDINIFESGNCGDSAPLPTTAVVAESAADAADALPCTDLSELETNPPAPDGCGFFFCSFAI